ncbi:MAG TPA: hypothetical protein VGC97_08695 [Pyrinomonadaceae bacterium]|jgi:hypothetical protein
MSEVKFNGTIHEEDGTYYQVQLEFVPRIGEFINFHSFVELIDDNPAYKYYEVIRIVHEITDVTNRVTYDTGSQFVSIYVKNVERPKEIDG